MENKVDASRRTFLARLGTTLLAAGAARSRAEGAQNLAWTPPPVLKNPNILVIMVDQMRLPMWLSSNQLSQLGETVLPNIVGRISANSYNFGQYFSAATICTSARSTLLTGLYVPQTAMYITSGASGGPATVPALNPAFPTWAAAVPRLNPAYRGNMWWFGKWHLSNNLNATPLAPYGFHTRTYPGGASAPFNPSPDGAPNEGTDGGLFNTTYWANDSDIAGDFIGWLQGQAPTAGLPSTPWCATVSLNNPHDITDAPGWLGPVPPPGLPLKPVYFPPPPGSTNPPSFYTDLPSPWNYEDLTTVLNKPSIQYGFQSTSNQQSGTVTDWVLFLNQYFWLQNFADQQVGLVLDALSISPFANNTIIIFLADHGEYAGSHGLHDKGYAVYDESLRCPLYVQFPGQSGSIAMNQMCSGVDAFGLLCDLVSRGGQQWRQAYPDLAHRQSLWSFLYKNSAETRVAPAPVGLPYVLHTFDQTNPDKNGGKPHIVCLRTKLDLNAGAAGAKLAFYWAWDPCTTYPNSTPPDPEFYDYNPQTTSNASEIGNDYYSNNAQTQNTIALYRRLLGSWGPPATGLIASELNRPLIGMGTNGKPLTQALTTAQQTYFNWLYGTGGCPG